MGRGRRGGLSSPSVQSCSSSGRGRPHPSRALPPSVLCSNVLPLYGRAPGRLNGPRLRAALGPVSSGDFTVPRGWPRPTDRDRASACAAADRVPDSLALTVLGADRFPSAAVPEHGQRALHLQGAWPTSLTPHTAGISAPRPDGGHHGGDHSVERPERRARVLLGNTPRPLRTLR